MLIVNSAEAFASALLTIGMMCCNPPRSSNTAKYVEAEVDRKTHDTADLKALEDRFLTAFRSKDVDAIMQLCVTDDSLVVFDVHPPRQINGAQAYRKDWETFFARVIGPLEVEVSDLDVTTGGDVAYVRSIHHVKGTMHDGKKVDYTVRVTDCFKKISGKWLIAHTHVSVPVDMQTGTADIGPKP